MPEMFQWNNGFNLIFSILSDRFDSIIGCSWFDAAMRDLQQLIQETRVLVVEDDHMRKIIRSLLQAVGIKKIADAPSGLHGLDAILSSSPDLVIYAWDMRDLSGAEFMRIVRSPDVFPRPSIPVIATGFNIRRQTVIEAMCLGVHEVLSKPLSAKILYEHISAIRLAPRRMVRQGSYYGPAPRAGSVAAIEPLPNPVWLT